MQSAIRFLVNSKWHLPDKLPRIHAFTPFPYKNVDGYGDLNFGVQIFGLLGV